jgi:hypothetical protein
MSTAYRVAIALLLGLLPLAWSILLIPTSRNLPKWMLPLNWYELYMLPVLLLGAAAIAYLRPRALTIPAALFYIPLMYLWTLGFTLGVCAEFFGGCK